MTAKSEDYQSEYFSDPEELKDEQEKRFKLSLLDSTKITIMMVFSRNMA